MILNMVFVFASHLFSIVVCVAKSSIFPLVEVYSLLALGIGVNNNKGVLTVIRNK